MRLASCALVHAACCTAACMRAVPQEYAITSDEALAMDELPEGPIVVMGAG